MQPLSGLKPVVWLVSQRLLGFGLMFAGRVRGLRQGSAGLGWCSPELGALGFGSMLAGPVQEPWSEPSTLD